MCRPTSISNTFILILLLVSACKVLPTKQSRSEHFTIGNITWENYGARYHVEFITIDTVLVKSDSATITVINNENIRPPQTLKNAFRNQFNAVYYDRFFDKVLMDPKVKKIFRDSVTIVDVYVIDQGSDTGCMNCNVKALLKFKDKIFDFPVQMNDGLISDIKLYDIQIEEHAEFTKAFQKPKDVPGGSKIYVWKDNRIYMLLISSSFKDADSVFQTIYWSN